MADISNEQLYRAMIKDPGWCLFFHRDQVKRMLPVMAENHVLVINIRKRLKEDIEKFDIGKLEESIETIMGRSELRPQSHSMLPDAKAVEVWHGGQLVATVYGADGPGVRVISKHPMDVIRGGHSGFGENVKVIEVRMELKKEGG